MEKVPAVDGMNYKKIVVLNFIFWNSPVDSFSFFLVYLFNI